MKRFILLAAFLAVSPAALFAQSIVLKDGKTIPAKGVRRQGDLIMATQELTPAAPGQKAGTGEFGYPLANIDRIEFPEPAQLTTASNLLAQGKAAEALTQMEPAFKYYDAFRDIPGSWWGRLALLKIHALAAQGKHKEAQPIVKNLERFAADPEIKRAAEVQGAGELARNGDFSGAMAVCDRILKEAEDSATLVSAAILKGECHLGLKEWDLALLAYLQAPVFYPEQVLFLPASKLGVARAHASMDGFTAAKTAYQELLSTWPASPEAAAAKAELEKLEKREKALAAK